MLKMRADASITIRMNKSIKQQAQKLFADLGIDMSSAINLFIKQAIFQNGLPFEVGQKPNAVTLSAIEDANSGKLEGDFQSTAELLASLNA